MQEKTREIGTVLNRQSDELPTTNLQRRNLKKLEQFGVMEAQYNLLNNGLLARDLQFGFGKNFRESLIIEYPNSERESVTSIKIRKGTVLVDGVAVESKVGLSQTIIDTIKQKK